MQSIIDEIHTNLIKYANTEIFNIKYDIKETIFEVNNNMDEIERMKLKSERAKELKKEHDSTECKDNIISDSEDAKTKNTELDTFENTKHFDIVNCILTVIMVFLGILIIYGLYDIHQIQKETALRQEQQQLEYEKQAAEYEERQRQANLKYYEVYLTDKFNRDITLSYPKEFTEIESESDTVKRFISDYDDTLEIKVVYSTTLEKIREDRIEEFESLGVNIYKLSDIVKVGDITYYTDNEPNTDIYNYIIGCDFGGGSLLLININQKSTLITKEYVEDYIKYIDETLSY